jgi:hypothetical protein
MSEQITHQPESRRGRFVVHRSGTHVAELTYTLRGDVMSILHAEVVPSHRGKGVGRRLVDAAARWARAQHHHVVPVCGYARSVLEGSAEYSDVLTRRPVKR